MLPQNKKFVIFGAGEVGQRVLKAPIDFAYFVDNDSKKQGICVQGLYVKSPESILEDKDDCFVIVASNLFADEICNQLEKMGLKKDVHFADSKDLNLESPVIKQLRINVTRKCNSRCLICNVWKDKPTNELNVDEMQAILRDRFFRCVQHVYITGGEPSAIPNFAKYIKMIVDTLPSLRSVSTVVNGLLPEKIENMINECCSICNAADVWFGVSVSLDGFEEDNDLQRGVKGSFNKAVDTIERLKKHNVNLTISTTISKLNINRIEEFYEYASSFAVPINIKLGINADFFNNEESRKYFEYSEEEIFKLKRLFYSMSHNSESSEFSRNVALNQFYMLEGSKRLLSCPYLECEAASLTETGQLRYCCSKSKDLGSVKDNSAMCVFQNNRDYLEFMGYTNCVDCNADAFSAQSPAMKSIIEDESYWQQFYAQRKWITSLTHQSLIGDVYHFSEYDVIFTGYLGSESKKDIEKIKSIINRYRDKKAVIASSLPFVTEYYLREYDNLKIISVNSKEFLNACYYVNEIVPVILTKPYYPWIECAEFIQKQRSENI